MKRCFVIIAMSVAFALSSVAQITDTPLRVVISDESGIPAEAADYLYNRLLYMVTGQGVGVDNQGTSQFYISARTITESKDVVGGAPTVYSLGLNVILYVVDWVNDQLYTRTSVSVKGAGESETKAYINAFKHLSVNNRQIEAFLADARDAIINYYTSQGAVILQNARTLASMRDYERAMFTLSAIPSSCLALYNEAQTVLVEIYGEYVDYVGQRNLDEARNIWASTQTREGAVMACALLSEIDPAASCYPSAVKLSEEIQKQMGQISEMKVYNDSVDLKKQQIEAARQIGVSFGNNQQPHTTNLL